MDNLKTFKRREGDLSDTELLDWLDTQCYPVAENQNRSDPSGEHVANEWNVVWPAPDIRSAIRAVMHHQQKDVLNVRS